MSDDVGVEVDEWIEECVIAFRSVLSGDIELDAEGDSALMSLFLFAVLTEDPEEQVKALFRRASGI